ncbi:hypothetical protein GPOL_c07530 [Gordonia polyisoprenivorans VH2]|uniref:DUF4244 domain-containing protein n=2 Tax=Gordonia polyisoprenivorans TaxID=84595 RepID=H6MXQ1_GORPV|nr:MULTISPECIES: DUF4244 domain-containing protein [Gordonia]AFA71821.1 hypothetical protein GPOL_c07530 [Gordonia polyisoprenivorans VH2]MDF3280613.1 DUF4244 domain-containing protein [Gordonia sp. N1V]NKY00004.1 DUF4244 domain-containing protein [Gordonia polyisoprenivorans]OPX12666.1 hypothetical protein B1964_21190 [Gordonia sp. i37]GAB25624.1 hypothetical protein GOPIP_087_00140 [Gordonia polyisoprenivorans NBRC 16320 = JCM 10675]
MSHTVNQSSPDHADPIENPRGLRAAGDWLNAQTLRLISDEEGMSTAEYAIGTIAAAAFGAILYTVVTGNDIVSALTGIINKALNTSVS